MKYSDYPSLRLLIPFTGGILAYNTIGDTPVSLQQLFLLLTLLCFATMLFLFCGKQLAKIYGLLLSVTLFVSAYTLSQYQLEKVHVEWHTDRRIYSGMLKDYPIEKAKSYRLDLELIDTLYGGVDVILYVPKDSLSKNLVPGSIISFNGQIKSPSNESIDGDFDYATYLYRNGVSGTLWVNESCWQLLPDSCALAPLSVLSVKCRKMLLDKYREWGLQEDVYAVVAAVTVGYKNELTDELRTIYSTSGASHVLAVSGLHVGILFAILSFLFPLFMNRMCLRWIKEIIVIAVLWCYAFMIGLPYSITRSLIMFTTLAVCRSIGRENSSLNALAFAALAILAANTNALFDIGFQLSFLAVLAILLWEPQIRRTYTPTNRVTEYLWGITTVSLSAQLGTAPLVMLNFANYSTYFLLTNFIVIPLMFVIVFVAVLMLIFSFIPIIRTLFVWILIELVTITNRALSLIVDLPYSSLSVENVTAMLVCCLYLSILFVYLYLIRKNSSYLIYLLSLWAIWSLGELYIKLG